MRLPFLIAVVFACGCAMADIGEGEDPVREEIGLKLDNGIFLDSGSPSTRPCARRSCAT